MLRPARVLLVCGCLACAAGITLVYPPFFAGGAYFYVGPVTGYLLLTPVELLILYLASWFLQRGRRSAAGITSLAAVFQPGVLALAAASFTWHEAGDAIVYARLGNIIRRQAIAGIALVGFSTILLAGSCALALLVTWRMRLPVAQTSAAAAKREKETVG
jgi:hypothetical protein